MRDAKSKPPGRRSKWSVLVPLAIAAAGGVFIFSMLFKKDASAKIASAYQPRPHGELTFSRDVAPIIYENCSVCHRPGQSAPFSLLTWKDVQKHAKDIVAVTQRRYMPPWPPEPGHGDFIGERRLTPEQLGILRQWTEEGCKEGGAAPPAPKWNGEWQLGPPDLVAQMPRPYTLPAEGSDIYRNFVVPVALPGKRYVRAVEFRPRTARVHHAFIRVDHLGAARHLEQQESQPGFPGITISADSPGGHFLSWQPGRVVTPLPEGLSWEINPGDDLVFQLHMNPSGKPEQIQAEIGLYFTDQPPTNSCVRVLLTSTAIDIPAGESHYEIRDEYRLPVDFDLLAILGHAHYLGKEIEAKATLPDGTVVPLLWIRDWDFNWQSDYRYKKPVALPRGTVLSARFVYDNSSANIRNPNHPPKRVLYGLQSTDEMGELWLQLLPHSRADVVTFQEDYGKTVRRRMIEGAQFALERNPNDSAALSAMGMIDYGRGKRDEAEQRFRAALASDPRNAEAHYGLGLVFRRKEQPAKARIEFEKALEADPWSWQSHGNLGFVCADLGDIDGAERHFREALRLNPNDGLAKAGLEELLAARRKLNQ